MGIADLVTLDELRAAQKRVAGVAVRTPLLPARWAGDVWLKPESLQPIGAFKIRGAYTKIAALTDDERRRGVIAPSSGNHAQAVAYAARAFGIRAVLVMPESAAGVKVAATRALGADVILVPVGERSRTAELAEEHGYVVVPPYDDRHVIAGQGTVGLEIVEDLPDVGTVVVPVSGGGLISGVAAAVSSRSRRRGSSVPSLSSRATRPSPSGKAAACPGHPTTPPGRWPTGCGYPSWAPCRGVTSRSTSTTSSPSPRRRSSTPSGTLS